MKLSIIGGVCLAAILAASPARAMVECRSGKGMDDRVCVVPYSEGQVVHVYAELRSMVLLQFGDDEENPRIIAADTTHLTFVPDGNYAVLKPTGVVWHSQPVSIMTTNRKTRKVLAHVIQLDVHEDQIGELSPVQQAANTPRKQLLVRYTYPADAAAERAAKWRERQAVIQTQKAKAELSMNVASQEDCNWVEQHDPAHPLPFVPTSVCSDGRDVRMSFPGNMPVPAVTIEGPDGKESAPMKSFDASTGVLTISGVARHYWLRYGDALDCVWKIGPIDPIGSSPNTGTASPTVVRTLRAASN